MKCALPVTVALAIGLAACATSVRNRVGGRGVPTADPTLTSSATGPPEAPTGDSTDWSGGWISGQVSDDAGMPVAGALVRASFSPAAAADDSREFVTDLAGHWWIPVTTTGVASLAITADHFQPTRIDGVSFVAGERRRGVDVVLPDGVAISGRVTSGDGQPLGGFAVTIESDGVKRRGRTNPRGEYSVDGLRAGSECVVDVAESAFRASGGEAVLPRRVLAPASAIDLTVTRASRLRVRCVDSETGELLSNAWGALQSRADGPSADPAALEFAWERGAILEFGREVQPGAYRLFATSRGYEAASPRDVVLDDAEAATDLTLTLVRKHETATGSLRVAVHDDRGEPVAGSFVWMHRTRLGSERTTIGDVERASKIVADLLDHGEQSIFGREVVPDLEPGAYVVTVFSENEWLRPGAVEVEIAPNEAAHVDVTLPRTGRLAVSGEDAHGDPVIGYVASVADSSGNPVRAVFATDGAVKFKLFAR
ncbi:MAG: carboxypeptidase regulatory-like domain-containing protein, partial [Planctomycetes bacterium]|nr:carboxypeptidase regulatory-like domain-containing protein [Planctomycetota bacterium]